MERKYNLADIAVNWHMCIKHKQNTGAFAISTHSTRLLTGAAPDSVVSVFSRVRQDAAAGVNGISAVRRLSAGCGLKKQYRLYISICYPVFIEAGQ